MRKKIALVVALLFLPLLAAQQLYIPPFTLPATTCTNQFIRSVAAATGIGTCATVSLTADVANTLPVANGGTTVTSLPMLPQGRLTLTSATPVLIAAVSAATTIYYTPYTGALVPFYDGTNFYFKVCAEISNITSNSSTGNAGPAAVAASKVYDLYVWDNAGTCTLSRSTAWTNDTTRANTLTRTNGIWLNTSTETNGPAASRGTYVGTVRSNASSQIDYIFGASAAGGTAAFFGVWNAYNRVNVTTVVTDSNASWVTTTSATPAALDTGGTGSGLNNRVTVVTGLAEDGSEVSLALRVNPGGIAGAGSIGFAMDVTNAFDKRAVAIDAAGVAGAQIGLNPRNAYAPQLGVHFWQALQAGDGTNAMNITGANEMAFVWSSRM